MNPLSSDQFRQAIEYWLTLNNRQGNKNKLPHGIFPGSTLREQIDIYTEQRWKNYQWNPPGTRDFSQPDPVASAKPTWRQLHDMAEMANIRKQEQQKKDADWHAFRTWTREQICARIFEAHDLIDEVMKRAKGAIPKKKEDMAARVKLVHRRHRRNIKQSHPTSKRYQTVLDNAYAAVAAEIDRQLDPPDQQP